MSNLVFNKKLGILQTKTANLIFELKCEKSKLEMKLLAGIKDIWIPKRLDSISKELLNKERV